MCICVCVCARTYVRVCAFIWVNGMSVYAKCTNEGQKTASEDNQALSSIL